MSLSVALNNALSGLKVNQSALAVLSQNIANANTAGYSRQIVNQQAVYLSGQGAGVTIADINRKVDQYLTRAVQLQSSVVSRASTVNEYATRTQLLLGSPGSSNNLNTHITNFFNALAALSLSPENSSMVASAVRSGDTFAKQVNKLAQGLYDLRFEADKEIKTVVDNINANIKELYSVNVAIANATTGGQNPIGLLDRRDILLKELSQYIDIQTYVRDTGALNVFTTNGVSLVDENQHVLSYLPASSVDAFIDDTSLSSIVVSSIDAAGNIFAPVELVSGGPSSEVSSLLVSGKLKGLLDLRDRNIPSMLAQLDNMASVMREQFNAVHNAGIPYPGLRSYVGTRSFFANDYRQWSGSVRIGVLGLDGLPVNSGYSSEVSGARPLTLDLGALDTGNGAGFPSMQGIVDEINRYLGPPANKVVLGNLNNIRLASDTTTLPGVPPQFSFDFDLENISAGDATFFVSNVQVLDSTNADITSVTQDVPTVDLAATGTYITSSGSNSVTVNTTSSPGVAVGDTIFLSTPPGTDIDGIPVSELGGYVTVTGVSGNSFSFETTSFAGAGGSFDVVGQTAKPAYAVVEAGDYRRTTNEGTLTVDLSLNTASPYYTVVVDVGVVDEDGNLSTSQVTYRIDNSQSNLLNNRYAAQSANGDGTLVLPNTTQSLARAMLVDANGNELPKFNGIYTTSQEGYLKIVATNSNHVVAIDSLDSQELGQPSGNPPATNRGFSYYFGLNNFFTEDDLEDTITNSALNLAVRDDIVLNPNLISLGSLIQSSSQPGAVPLYTYERQVGDNSAILELADFANTILSFSAAGGLGQSNQSMGGYLAQIIGTAATNAANAQSDEENEALLLEGYEGRADSASGVNLDEELANTIIYQNAYTASARALSVSQELFDTLLQSFGQ